MRLKQYINEEYFKRLKWINNSFETFINPSQKEMKEIDSGTGIRFIADLRDKTVYAWDSMEIIHNEAWKQIKPKENERTLAKKGTLLEGLATKKGGKYKMIISDQIDYYFSYDIYSLKEFKKNFKWVDKYINVTDQLDDWIDHMESQKQ